MSNEYFKVIEHINENYDSLSSDADMIANHLIKDFEYKITELCIYEDEVEGLLYGEISRSRAVLEVPTLKQIIDFEDKVYFQKLYQDYHDNLDEIDEQNSDRSLDRYRSIYLGLSSEDMDIIKEKITSKEIFEEENNAGLIKVWAFKKYFRYLKGRVHTSVNAEIENESNEKSGLVLNQKILWILLVQDVNKISKHQDRSKLIESITLLTGNSNYTVKASVYSYYNNNGFIKKSTSENLKDYKIMRDLFFRLENKEIVAIVDKRIAELEKMPA